MTKRKGPGEERTLGQGDEITDEATGRRYRLLSLVGEGGMGRVYRAEDVSQPGRFFAVKCNQPLDAKNKDLIARARNEGKFLQGLKRHPHIVPVLATGMTSGGSFWMLMPLLDGDSVGGLLSVLPRIPLVWALAICRAVCNALAVVHEVAIHRDIKPDNVFLTRDGGVYVLDFGAGKFYAVGRLTTTGMAVGTAPYMSPEQLQDSEQIDGRSDLFSLGVLAFEMLTGKHPFRSDNPLEQNRYAIGMRIIYEAPRSLAALAPDLPGYMTEILGKMLAKRPEHRNRDAAEAEQVLAAAQAELRSRLGEPPPLARIFDAYDEMCRRRDAAQLATQDTDEAAPALRGSGARPKFGTVPLAAFGAARGVVAPGAAAAAVGPAPAVEERASTAAAGRTAPMALAALALPVPEAEGGAALSSVEPDAEATQDADELDLGRKFLAIERLAEDDSPETRKALLDVLVDYDDQAALRGAAAMALRFVGDQSCIAALDDLARHDPEPLVRQMAAQAVLEITLRTSHAAGSAPVAALLRETETVAEAREPIERAALAPAAPPAPLPASVPAPSFQLALPRSIRPAVPAPAVPSPWVRERALAPASASPKALEPAGWSVPGRILLVVLLAIVTGSLVAIVVVLRG